MPPPTALAQHGEKPLERHKSRRQQSLSPAPTLFFTVPQPPATQLPLRLAAHRPQNEQRAPPPLSESVLARHQSAPPSSVQLSVTLGGESVRLRSLHSAACGPVQPTRETEPDPPVLTRSAGSEATHIRVTVGPSRFSRRRRITRSNSCVLRVIVAVTVRRV